MHSTRDVFILVLLIGCGVLIFERQTLLSKTLDRNSTNDNVDLTSPTPHTTSVHKYKPGSVHRQVRIVVVTYKEGPLMIRCIESVLNSTVVYSNFEIIIINNYSGNTFPLWMQTCPYITIVHNNGRPDFSVGYLARSWNQALIYGFQSLVNPVSEIVVALQGDSVVTTTWWDELQALHQRWSLIQMGTGDQLMSYRVDGVRNVGLWDERFCGIGAQEADYFLRAVLYNRDNTTINDHPHGRVFQPLDVAVVQRVLVPTPTGNNRGTEEHKVGSTYHRYSEVVFAHKWSGVKHEHWEPNRDWTSIQPRVASYFIYPYFEKHINGLKEKKYLGPF